MDTAEIAQKLCDHCRNGTEAQALKELYAQNAVSVEAFAGDNGSPVAEGVEAIQAKHDWWNGAFEVHGVEMDGLINGDKFSVIFEIDCTEKSSGNRWKGKEVALYEVENGKIARESFFMQPMG